MARLSLTLLGGFQCRPASGPALTFPTKKAQALLAYLALRPGQPHPRGKLAALLWGDTGEEQARSSLRQAVHTLRKALCSTTPPGLLIDGENLALSPLAVEVDAAAFERLAAEGRPEALEQAAALYQGDLLEGLSVTEPPFEEWLLAERERLRELALEALAKLLACQSKAGEAERAIQTAVRLLALDPLQEAAHRALMRLYARQGRRGAALKQYQLCVGVLQRELGAQPESETRQLYEEILKRQPAGGAKTEAPPISRAHQPRSGTAQSRPAAPTPETLLIGREPELARLSQALDEAWRGRGQIVAVLGEAGIGKSRLVEEIGADALQRGGQVLTGRSSETEQILPFGPWVDALRAGQVVLDVEMLRGLNPVWRAELARLFPELGEPGLDPSPAPENSLRLFDAVAQLVGHLASAQPFVLVLEDLHWADEMSLRLLSFLGRRVPAGHVLLVATAREEEMVGAPLLRRVLQDLDRERRLVSLTLSPLSQPDTVTLVRELARGGSEKSAVARLGEQVWKASEGNPFMVVEMMQALQEGTAPQATSRLPLPQRVREIIAGRLERLSDRGRALAAVAAVIGREFDFTLLQRASGLGESEAAEGMEELVRRRILHGVGERFDFTHDRIREVAYEGLLAPRRQALHAAAGQALEALYAEHLEEVYDRLAHHYSKTEEADKAVNYLTRFADKAARSYALGDAVTALQEALVHVERLPAGERDSRRVDVILRQARSLFLLGRAKEALPLILKQQERVERLQNPRMAGRYYFLLGNIYSYLGDHDRSSQSAERALESAAECGDEAAMGKARYLLALEGFWSQPAQGEEHGRQAIDLLERTREQWWLGQAHWLMGLICCYLGEFEGALEALARAGAIADETWAQRLQSYVAWTTGFVRTLTGEWMAGIDECKRGVESAPDAVSAATAMGMLSLAYLENGDPDDALPLLEKAVPQTRNFQIRTLHGLFTTFLGEAWLLKGDLAKAREMAVQGLEITREAKYWYAVGWTQRALGRVALAGGAPSEAEIHFTEALETFSSIQARFEMGRTQLALAEIARSQGNREAATINLKEAREVFRALKVPKYVERAEQLSKESGDAAL